MLLRQSTLTGLSLLSQVTAAFVANVVVARLLPPSDYGVYAFWLAVVTLVVVPASGGLPQLLVRELAAFRELQQPALARGLLRWASKLTVAITCGVVLVGMFATKIVWSDNIYTSGAIPLLALCSIPFLALSLVRAGAMSGLGAVVVGGLPERMIRPLLFLLGVTLLWLIGNEATTAQVLSIQLCAALLAFLIGVAWLRRRASTVLGNGTTQSKGWKWFSGAIPLGFIATVQMLLKQADVILLGFLAQPEDVGLYQVAARVALLVGFIHLAYTTVLSPQVSRLWALGDIGGIRKLVSSGTAFATLITTVIVGALLVIGDEALVLVFGDAYAAAYPLLAVLLVGQWVNTFFGPVGLLLNMTSHLRSTVNVMILTAVINITLSVALIRGVGAIGAAYSTLVSYVVFNTVLYLQCKRLLNVDASALGVIASRAR